jgi:ABC-type Fe3+/spermidine/putrescine transport system ATPase subunit
MSRAKKYIQIKNVSKRFGKLYALKEINLEVEKGEYIVILGPTGAGKTTLLKILAGLIKPTHGEVYKDNLLLNGAIPPEKRNMAYLPQTSDYSLFQYMNVWENTTFSPRMKGEKSWKDIISLADEILDLVNLRMRYDAYPNELSGGMKQRVALARAMAADADIFLFDEPLRALDARLRIKLRSEIRKLVTDLHKTTFHVTHDQEEAIAIADKVLIMNEGKIIQFNVPEEIYNHPNSLFSAYFFGETNLIPVQIPKKGKKSNILFIGGSKITIEIEEEKAIGIEQNQNLNEAILTIKGERIDIDLANQTDSDSFQVENVYRGLVESVHFLGKWVSLEVTIDGFPRNLNIKIPSKLFNKFTPGSEVIVKIPPKSLRFFSEPWDIIKQLEL